MRGGQEGGTEREEKQEKCYWYILGNCFHGCWKLDVFRIHGVGQQAEDTKIFQFICKAGCQNFSIFLFSGGSGGSGSLFIKIKRQSNTLVDYLAFKCYDTVKEALLWNVIFVVGVNS